MLSHDVSYYNTCCMNDLNLTLAKAFVRKIESENLFDGSINMIDIIISFELMITSDARYLAKKLAVSNT